MRNFLHTHTHPGAVKYLIITVLVCFLAMSAEAKITHEEAVNRAGAFINSSRLKSNKHGIVDVDRFIVASEADNYYMLKTEKSDVFVIVNSSESSNNEILGYGFGNGELVAEPLSDLLASYIDITCPDGLYGPISPIEPLLGNIKWNQNYPYNGACPEVDGTDGKTNAVAGCVAVAMGQIMAYHRYPNIYDWDNILPDYMATDATDAQKNEVARLLRDIGECVNMRYSAESSGALTSDAKLAFVSNFDYSTGATWLSTYRGSMYGISESWIMNPAAFYALIYEELLQKRPVMIGGSSKNGKNGHSFVCDGCDENGFLHINWGWGGLSDGYFSKSLLNPTEQGIGGSTHGYDYCKDLIYGICPPDKGSAVSMAYMYNKFTVAEDGKSCSLVLYRHNGQSFVAVNTAIGIYYGIKFTDEDGRLIKYVSAVEKDSKQLEAYDLPDGSYRVYPVWRDSPDSEWLYILPRSDVHPYVLISVESGKFSFSNIEIPTEDALKAVDFKVPETVELLDYVNSLNGEHFSFILKNEGRPQLTPPALKFSFINEETGDRSIPVYLEGSAVLGYGQSASFTYPVSQLFADATKVENGTKHRLSVSVGDTEIGLSEPFMVRSRGFHSNVIQDGNLRLALRKLCDKNNDQYFSDTELAYAPQVLDLENQGIKSVNGLEAFYNTTTLMLSNNSLKEVELGEFPHLFVFYADYNKDLKRVDLSLCKSIERVSIYDCSLDQLTLPALDSSMNLQVDKNNLSELDLSVLKNGVNYLSCNDNKIASLDLSRSVDLEALNCENNLLTSLDLSKTENLTAIRCSNNLIEELKLGALDKLKYLQIPNNKLTNLDIEGALQLYSIDASCNSIVSARIKGCKALDGVNLEKNRIEFIDIDNTPKLTGVLLRDNCLWFFNNPKPKVFLVDGQTVVSPFGGSIDLSEKVTQGMNLSKIKDLNGATLVDDKLMPIRSYYRSVISYQYDGAYFQIVDADAKVSLDREELVLPEIGSMGDLIINDPGSIVNYVNYSKNIEMLSRETITEYIKIDEYSGTYNTLGEKITFRRIAEGDGLITVSVCGSDPLTCKVVSESSGIESVNVDDVEPQISGYYNMLGHRISSPEKGEITIIRYSDGSSRKVIVK